MDETRAFLDPYGLRFDPTGVPGRTPIQHLRDFKGTSSMHYPRTARYEKARDSLGRAETEDSVTEIVKLGFSHMGRFSSNIAGALARARRRCCGSAKPCRVSGKRGPAYREGETLSTAYAVYAANAAS